ncbi:MAG: hypothetical protein QUS12_05825, partial [Methanosarcina sp.]|nr:hypothetical protein [Methanosarcina sp.]
MGETERSIKMKKSNHLEKSAKIKIRGQKQPEKEKGKQKEIEERVKKIIRILRQEYPSPQTALHYRTPFELLVATILAAQCTDERVNKVTPGLFQKYPTVEA